MIMHKRNHTIEFLSAKCANHVYKGTSLLLELHVFEVLPAVVVGVPEVVEPVVGLVGAVVGVERLAQAAVVADGGAEVPVLVQHHVVLAPGKAVGAMRCAQNNDNY